MSTFDPKTHERITEFIEKHETNTRARKIAVFDADGTLWRGDVGEDFFKLQIQKKWIKADLGADPWSTYWNEVQSGDAVKAYGNLATWNDGVSVEDMRRWCHEFVRDHYAQQIFEPMRTLTHALMNAGFEVWIVSASPRWQVEECAKGFGVPADRIIAVTNVVRDGFLTGELAYPVPYRDMKRQLIERMVGDRPMFAGGNTYWDHEMLDMATGMAIAIHSEEPSGPNFSAEQKLREHVAAKAASGGSVQWLVQKF